VAGLANDKEGNANIDTNLLLFVH